MTVGIGRPAIAAIACTAEGIHMYPTLRRPACILHSNRNGFRHHYLIGAASRQDAVVRSTAPELRAIQIRPEAISALRQGERDLPAGIGRA